MSTSDARPTAVTYACLIAGTSSLLMLVNIFVLLGDWGSLEVRQQIEQAFEDAPFGNGGISVEDAIEFLRVAAMGAAACCVAAVVLSVFTARRDRVARILLTVLAGGWLLVSLLIGVAGLLLAILGGLSMALLWRPESRAWFAGAASDRPAVDSAPHHQHVSAGPDQRTTHQENPMTTPPSDSSGGQYGQPQYPGASQPSQHGSQPPQYGQSYGEQGSGYPQYGGNGGSVPTSRPGGVTAASVITMVFAAITGAFWLVIGFAMLVASNSIVEAIRDSTEGQQVLNDADLTVTQLEDGITVFGVIALVAGVLMLLVIWPAIGVLRGGGVARIFVVIASVVTVLISLFFLISGALIAMIWLAAGILVIVFLFVGGAGAWFDYKAHERDSRR